MDSVAKSYRSLLEAVSFAARAHARQMRKDGRTPYAAHPCRVGLIARHVFGIDDPAVLTAALLHDTIEDTTTDCDDLIEQFGAEIAGWVAILSKDKRLPDDEREERYRENLRQAPWQVKVCKLADIFDNLLDSSHLPADKRRRTIERSRGYLAALNTSDLPPAARRAIQLVQQLLAETDAGHEG
jgi:guanosine-3',5'-bis(diphosphate) 3'-pyrophosphohydrolase